MKILLTGASGYLGQHLLWHWMNHGTGICPQRDQQLEVVALYHQSKGLVQALEAMKSTKIKVTAASCDMADSEAIDRLFQEHHGLEVCVHAAAMSNPRACQEDPSKAQQINVPIYLFQKMKDKRIIALSTDQVFDGTTSDLYREDHPTNPLNVYGETKLKMEASLREMDAVILRSSIILGPKAPLTKAHETFLHFCASRDGQKTTFFSNEYRNVVCVDHVCRIISFFLRNPSAKRDIYHMGGPIKVNRLEMAEQVFDFLGYDKDLLVAAEQTSPTSPLDIGMDSRKLAAVTKIEHEPRHLKGMVEMTLRELQR